MNMSFNYVIKNAEGLFFNGCAYGDGRDWTNETREGYNGAFRYTLAGAYRKIETFPAMFGGCTVEND